MEYISGLTFYELLESDVDYENSNEYNDYKLKLGLWSLSDDIQEHLRNKFKDELDALNDEFEVLMRPVTNFVADLRLKLVNKELDVYNINKEVKKLIAKSLKEKKKVIFEEDVVTI